MTPTPVTACTTHRSLVCRDGAHSACAGNAVCTKLRLTVDCLCQCHGDGDR